MPTDSFRPEVVHRRDPSSDGPDDRTIELRLLWVRLRRRARFIGLFAAATTTLAILAALLLPSWYRASASLLPPNEEDSGVGLTSMLKGLGVPGVKIPTEAQPADVFVEILKSRRIGEEIVEKFDLRSRYKRRLMADALRELGRHARFAVNDAAIITIDVEDRDPKRAAAMANAYVEVLDRFNREIRMTKGRRTRLFVSQRLQDTSDSLASAENQFATYQASHRAPPISPDAASAMSSIAGLYAQREALMVRLGVVSSYSSGVSDEETQIRAELAQLDRRLSAIPEAGMQSLRLLRQLKTLEQLKALLTAQYEQARIEEVRDVSTLEVLDIATPPERRARPQRTLLVAVGLFLGLAAGMAVALLETAPADRT